MPGVIRLRVLGASGVYRANGLRDGAHRNSFSSSMTITPMQPPKWEEDRGLYYRFSRMCMSGARGRGQSVMLCPSMCHVTRRSRCDTGQWPPSCCCGDFREVTAQEPNRKFSPSWKSMKNRKVASAESPVWVGARGGRVWHP